MDMWSTVLGNRAMESIISIAQNTSNLPTLRDQLAMAALISVGGTSWGMDVGNEKLAKECYSMADAMLKARKEKSNG